MTSPLLDLSELPFRPAAVLRLEPDESSTITDVVTPLLRAALATGTLVACTRRASSTGTSRPSSNGRRWHAFSGIAFGYPDLDGDVCVDRAGSDEPIVVIGLPEAGVRWLLPQPGRAATNESLDGSPVHVVFVILSGEDVNKDAKVKAGIARWASTRVKLRARAKRNTPGLIAWLAPFDLRDGSARGSRSSGNGATSAGAGTVS